MTCSVHRLRPARALVATLRTVAAVAALAIPLVLPAPALAQDAAAPAAARDTVDAVPRNFGHALDLARRAQQAGDNEALRRALRAASTFAPDFGLVLFHLARAEAIAGDAERALAALERLAPQGAVRDVAADSAFAALRTGAHAARFDAVVRRLAAAAVPLVRSDTGFVLAGRDFFAEGIAHDPVRDEHYVGSLMRGGVVRVTRRGEATTFLPHGQGGLGQVLGLRVDAARRRLWLATLVLDSAAPRLSDGGAGWAALHAYELPGGRLVARHAVPDSSGPHLLNDIAITRGGDVYVTDSEGDALYRLRAGGTALERVHGGARDFTYPNGVTLAPDERTLYVAHSEGISAVALAGARPGAVARLAAPAGVSATGIDGLYACGDGLLAVQRQLDLYRITRFDLAPGGRGIAAARALERRHPAHDIPTTGAIAGDAFFYIANAELQRLRPHGRFEPSTKSGGTVVLRLPLDGAC